MAFHRAISLATAGCAYTASRIRRLASQSAIGRNGIVNTISAAFFLG